ncbi:MAG: hypothetical protein GY719_17190 [bacterium]|nr:hypothetical protein [bacterium]
MSIRRLALAPLLVLAPSASAQAPYDPGDVGWSRLEFEATKFFITARSAVDLDSRPAAEASSELFAPAEGEKVLTPSGPVTSRIDIRTSVLGRDSKVRFWFEPGDARALERSELSLSSKRRRYKTYRYAWPGVHAHTVRPHEGEEDKPHEDWTRIGDQYIPFPEDLNGAVVTEPAALLYAVPAGALNEPGDELVMHVFSRRRVTPVDIRVAERKRLRVDYVEATPAGERTVNEEVETLRVTLRPRPPEDDTDSGGIRLLGLEGDIDLYLEPRTRTPLLVTGKIKIAGRVRLWLKRVVLRSP